jgi:uncharacterized protein DUF4402
MVSHSGSALAGVDSGPCRRVYRWAGVPALLAVAVVPALATSLHGQGRRPVQVNGVRSVSFGTVFPGISKLVLRTDALNSGRFDIRATAGSQLQLSFALPAAMTGPGGSTMPLSFGGGDAGFSVTQSVASQVGFDPRIPFVATMGGPPGRAAVFLGGTVTPLAAQPAGSYTGTITLTVVYFP